MHFSFGECHFPVEQQINERCVAQQTGHIQWCLPGGVLQIWIERQATFPRARIVSIEIQIKSYWARNDKQCAV